MKNCYKALELKGDAKNKEDIDNIAITPIEIAANKNQSYNVNDMISEGILKHINEYKGYLDKLGKRNNSHENNATFNKVN